MTLLTELRLTATSADLEQWHDSHIKELFNSTELRLAYNKKQKELRRVGWLRANVEYFRQLQYQS